MIFSIFLHGIHPYGQGLYLHYKTLQRNLYVIKHELIVLFKRLQKHLILNQGIGEIIFKNEFLQTEKLQVEI